MVTMLISSEERVRRGCEKLAKAVGQKQQGRLDGFFTYVRSIHLAACSRVPTTHRPNGSPIDRAKGRLRKRGVRNAV